jgi:hypothetical protein
VQCAGNWEWRSHTGTEASLSHTGVSWERSSRLRASQEQGPINSNLKQNRKLESMELIFIVIINFVACLIENNLQIDWAPQSYQN